MKKIILLAFLFVVLFSVPLIAAQTEGGTVYDPAVVELILAGIAGLTVIGITQMIKTWFKAEGALGYIISAVVSAGATAYFLTKTGGFTVPAFVGYTIFVFLAANGIYKAAS